MKNTMKPMDWLDFVPVLSSGVMAVGLFLSKSALADYVGVWLLFSGLMAFALWILIYAVLHWMGLIKSGLWAMPLCRYFGPDGP